MGRRLVRQVGSLPPSLSLTSQITSFMGGLGLAFRFRRTYVEPVAVASLFNGTVIGGYQFAWNGQLESVTQPGLIPPTVMAPKPLSASANLFWHGVQVSASPTGWPPGFSAVAQPGGSGINGVGAYIPPGTISPGAWIEMALVILFSTVPVAFQGGPFAATGIHQSAAPGGGLVVDYIWPGGEGWKVDSL